MTTASLPLATRDRVDVARTLKAGAAVGVLDGLAAMLIYAGVMGTTTPVRLWQGVASTLLGPGAIDGGLATTAFGLAMHFTIALGWASVYALLYRQVAALRRATRTAMGTVLVGAIFGAFVHVMMSRVLVPMTLAPAARPITATWFVGLAIHMTVVGQPIAWLVRNRA